MIVKDAMVLIHLAKMTVLEITCRCFRDVIIPQMVYEEIIQGKEKKYPDALLIEEVIRKNMVQVKNVTNTDLLTKAHNYNIQKGEAEAVALYWQEQAEYLASDDDNVRKKAVLLQLRLLGTPALLMHLYNGGEISHKKYVESVHTLKEIGWFSSAVIDTLLRRAKNGSTHRNKTA